MKVRHAVKRGFTRLSVLATLATFTVAIPLTGFVDSHTSLTVPGRDVTIATASDESWVAQDSASQDIDGFVAGDVATQTPEVLVDQGDATAKARLVEADRKALPDCHAQHAASGEALAADSQQKGTIYWPLKKGTFSVSSGFGYRFHPILHMSRLHAGTDMVAPGMTPIYAAADGVVTKAGPSAGSGNMIRIEHHIGKLTFATQYMHTTIGSIKVSVGDKVKAQQLIAGVGSTGLSTGNHLHFEVRINDDEPVDPMKWMPAHGARYIGEGSC